MKKAILAKKLGMTQVYAEDGTVVPVTVLQAGPCYVVQKKTVDKDGYEAVQIGFESIREKLVNKPAKALGYCVTCASSSWRMQLLMKLARKSRQMCSQKAIK